MLICVQFNFIYLDFNPANHLTGILKFYCPIYQKVSTLFTTCSWQVVDPAKGETGTLSHNSVTCMYINLLSNALRAVTVTRAGRKMVSLSSVSHSIAGRRRFDQHALPNTRSRVGCLTSEKSPLWALLTVAFRHGSHTWLDDVRDLTYGSSSEQSHFPTSSTAPLCSVEYLRSSDALSLCWCTHLQFQWKATGSSSWCIMCPGYRALLRLCSCLRAYLIVVTCIPLQQKSDNSLNVRPSCSKYVKKKRKKSCLLNSLSCTCMYNNQNLTNNMKWLVNFYLKEFPPMFLKEILVV